MSTPPKTSAQGRQAMRVSAIRFGTDLWGLLEREASLVGVSISQYVREAALARATAAAASRGEDPMALLAQGAPAGEQSADPSASARLRRSRIVVESQETRRDAQAVRAQSAQAVRQSKRLEDRPSKRSV